MPVLPLPGGGKIPVQPDLELALLVERFGPLALGPSPDPFDLMRCADILRVVNLYRMAGTDRQHDLTPGQWDMIVELDILAGQENG